MKKSPAITLALLLATGCVRHTYPYSPKVRDYEQAEYAPRDEGRTVGSLWSEGSAGLFEEGRASRVGDILTVRIEERADATRDAMTETSRESTTSMGVTSFFQAMQSLAANNPGLDPAALIAAASNSKFSGGGTTSRSGTLTASLPVHVKRELPNGDLYIEGTKVLLLNEEESHLYLSGVVRPVDILQGNTISSSRIADVELEYTGRGVISDRNSPGWFSRMLDYIWPF